MVYGQKLAAVLAVSFQAAEQFSVHCTHTFEVGFVCSEMSKT